MSGSPVSWSSMDSLGVGSSAFVGNLSDIAVVVVDVVVDMLNPAVRKSNGVRSLSDTVAIVRLRSLEVGFAVVISHGVVVGVGGNLISIGLNGMIGRGVVGGGSMVNSGSFVDRGSLVDRGSMSHRGVIGGSSTVDRGSHGVGNSMSSNTVSEAMSTNAM